MYLLVLITLFFNLIQTLFMFLFFFFFSSRRRHTRFDCDWSSDVCSSDLHSFGNARGGPFRAWAYQGECGAGAFPTRYDRAPVKITVIGAGVSGLTSAVEIGRASCRERV